MPSLGRNRLLIYPQQRRNQISDPFAGMFTMIIQSDNAGTSGTNQFTIPTTGSGYDYATKAQKVGGGTIDETSGNTGDVTLTFTDGAGQYKVGIAGDFPRIYFNNGGDRQKLIEVTSWGDIVWGSDQTSSFYGCSNLTSVVKLGTGHSSVEGLTRFLRGTGITTIDPAFLQNAPNTTTLSAFFFDAGLTQIDDAFLQYTPNIVSLATCFYNTNITQIDEAFLQYTPNVVNLNLFLFGTNLTTESYSDLLIWLAANYNTPSQNFHGGNATYNTDGATARSSLVDTYGWTITDGGAA